MESLQCFDMFGDSSIKLGNWQANRARSECVRKKLPSMSRVPTYLYVVDVPDVRAQK